MPLVSVTANSPVALQALETGTQYIEGTLSFSGSPASPTVLTLDGGLFVDPGDYILFTYDSFNDAQMANVTAQLINPSEYVGSVALINQAYLKRIIARISAAADNGTQYIGDATHPANLTFSGPTTMFLNGQLVGIPGTYDIFVVYGTVTGESNLNVFVTGGALRVNSQGVQKTTVGGVTYLKVTLEYY